MQVSAGELDVARFEPLIAQARAGNDPDERSAWLREALALWHGEPLAELQYEAFAEREIARLKELRLAAIEDRVDADLVLGRHHELVPELEALVAESPLRERLRGQLMLALYRCGRQAEALHVFQSGRRALGEELGIDPGPALQQLELRILRQDSSLDLAAPPAASAVATPLVARDHELAFLRATFDRVCLEGRPALVTVVGDAGVGKSRVVRELLSPLEDEAKVLIGRCLAYGHGVTL